MMMNIQDRDVLFEPCIQRKKRLDGPPTTLATGYNHLKNANMEYILLGKNDKFHDNVKYKCRPVDDPHVDDKGSDRPMTYLQVNSPKKSDPYMLLGSNNKFSKNVVYKVRSYPSDDVNEEDKENDLDEEDDTNKIKYQKEVITKPDDYILLGKNDKFTDNIIYRPKVNREFIDNDYSEKEISPIKAADDIPVQAKSLEPAPVIDTSKFREPPKKSKNLVGKSDDSEIVIKKKKKSSASLAEHDVRPPLDHLLPSKQATFKKGKADAVKFQSPPLAPRSPNRLTQVNEEADKKLLDLLHKSKIYIPPHPGVAESEYQKNFAWKKPLPIFPTAAENKKTCESDSVLTVTTLFNDPIPKLSEYQRNFQDWTPSPKKPASPIASTGKDVPHSGRNVQREARHKEDRTNIGVTTPEMSVDDDDDDDDDEDDDDEDDDAEQRNSVKRCKHLKSEKTTPENPVENMCNYSEYRANFKAHPKSNYVKTTWNQPSPGDEDLQRDDSDKGDWYSEVLNLRRKASEYRHRAEVSHFRAGHMGQLSDETLPREPLASVEEKRNLKSAGIIFNKQNSENPAIVRDGQSHSNSPPEPQMILEDVADDDDDTDDKPKADYSNYPRTMSEHDAISVAAPEECDVGRISTPERHRRRHHLDRTTPIKENLLITSRTNQMEEEYYPYNAMEHANSVGLHNARTKPKHCVQTCSLPSKINNSCTCGKANKGAQIVGGHRNTFDNTYSVEESQINTSPNVTLRSGNKRPMNSQETRPAGKPNRQMTSTGMSKTDLNQAFLSRSDSNTSLAADVLERSRKRLNFW